MKKPSYVLIISIFIVQSLLYSQFPWGTGTEEDPYHITTAEELNSVRDFMSSYFTLDCDIDLSDYLSIGNPGYNDGAFWEPIGTTENSFKGTIYGNMQKIKNLKINRPDSTNVGLFGYTEGTTIKDLKVEIDSAGKVIGKYQVGSLIGHSLNSSILNCSAVSSIEGEGNLGGLIGYCDSCFVSKSSAESNIKGLSGVGGMIGNAYRSEVLMCHSDGVVEGKYECTGGLIGVCTGTLKMSFSTSTVIGGELYSGGLTGGNWPCDLTYCYSAGNVSGSSEVGGLTGTGNGGTILNCYSTGTVIGSTDVGGLIGTNYGSVTSSYWDTETSGQAASAGGEGKTTAEMQSIATYTGWDFALTPIWVINEYLNDGYAYFNWDKNFYFAGGNGRPDNPFLIATPDHLNNVRNGMYANYRQTADIDLGVSPWKDGEGWNPIGYYNSDTDYGPFRGIYDGNVFIITNLTINRPLSHSTGLFGYIYQSTITNFNLQGVNVVGGVEYTGALAGIVNNGNVFNSVSNGSVSGGKFTGGLVGYNNSGSTIENCSTYGSVSAIGKCSGGLAGYNSSESIINLCFAANVVNGDSLVGGLVGMNNSSEIANSCAIGTITCNESGGGFAGCSADGINSINRCFSTGNVNGHGFYIGGFIGYTYTGATINDCYSRGNVIGGDHNGGFIGLNHSSNLINCYSTGLVDTSGQVGGFCGFESTSSYIENCYWDIETSGISTSYGAEGRTTDDMTYTFGNDTYTGWNFDTIWVGSYNNNDAYPHLAWQGLTGIEEDSNLPKVTELYQNYPNPFNPVTEIKFALNKDTDVSLSVYNSNGQLVKELVKDNMSAGYHNVTFDAAGLNSGLYFYRLNYGNKSISRKMIMIK
jgi:hypothetical protein